jgi:hypothetical protein
VAQALLPVRRSSLHRPQISNQPDLAPNKKHFAFFPISCTFRTGENAPHVLLSRSQFRRQHSPRRHRHRHPSVQNDDIGARFVSPSSFSELISATGVPK